MSSEHGHCSKSSNVREDEEQDQAERRRLQSDQKVSDKDISDVVDELTRREVKKLYEKLGIKHNLADISEQDTRFQGLDSAQQAKSVLRDHWLQPKPNDATRETILQALDQCEFINSKENLEIKWQIQDHNTIDQVSETDIIDVVEILTKEEIRKVYGRLRIDHKAVEKFEGIFRDDGPDEQAKSVLRDYWLQREGKKATRRTILEAVGRCGFVKPKKNLERTWQIQDEGQDPNIAYQGCIALKPTWTSDGLLSLQPEVSGFKDGNKIEISYTYGADGYEVYTYSQLSEPHILQGVDEDWRGRVTAKASDGLITAQCHVKVGSITIIPSWVPEGLRLIPEVTGCRISRKAEISYTYDTDDCEQSEKYLYSKKPHHLKGVKNTWSGFVTATVLDGLTIAQCQTEIEKEFDLQKFKEDIKTKYRTTLRSIISFPWNQFYHQHDQERNIEYMYVELELEKAVRRNKEVMTLSEDKTGSSAKITKEELLILKTSEGEDVRRILVKGLAGSGKSSLLAKIAYEWAVEKEQPKPRAECSPFKKYELVFLLRMNKFENNGLLLDEICKQLSLDGTVKGLKNYITQNEPEIMILMDSWDETKINNIKLNEIYGNMTIEQTLASQTLSETLVIVSSRPHKPLGSIQSKYGQVNPTGFSRQNINTYIRNFFSLNPNKDYVTEGMIKEIDTSKQLHIMAKVPIILMILCSVWNYDNSLPDTTFGLYDKFLTGIWERCEHTSDIQLQTIQRRIGEIAFQGLMSEHQIEEDIIEFSMDTFGGIVDVGLKVGYITKGWSFTDKEEAFITFLHKSVQEFFAGKYLAQLYHEGKQENFNYILKRLKSWDLVLDKFEILRFCCGDTLQSSDQCSLTIIGHVIRTYDTFYKSRTVSAVNTCNGCDGQSTDVTSYVDFGVMKESLSGHINSIDCLPILKLLQEAKIQDTTAIRERFSDSVFVTPMSVNIDCHNSQALSLFRNFLYWADCFSTVKEIKLIIVSIDENVDLLSDILSHVPNIHVLTVDLLNTNINDDTNVKLCKAVAALKQLSILNVYAVDGKIPNCLLRTLSKNRSSSTKMRHISIECLSPRIHSLTLSDLMTEQLTCLILYETGLSEKDIEDLSGYLSRSPQLRKLDLSGNHVGNSITPLTQSLMIHCRQLQILSLFNTQMRECHTQALINFLTSQLIDLIELELSFNDVGGVITEVSHCKYLQNLRLQTSGLHADHMSAIGNLPDTLQILDVSNNDIGDGLVKLLEALQNCQKLKELKLFHNDLADAGVVTLGQNLHRWPRLSHLIFDDNDNIGTSGVDSILSHIHHLRELQQLKFDFNRDTVYSPLVRDCLREIRECCSNSYDGSITVNIFESQAIQKIQHISREASQAAR